MPWWMSATLQSTRVRDARLTWMKQGTFCDRAEEEKAM